MLSNEQILADYREALHRGDDVSVEEAADKIPVYEMGNPKPVGSITVPLPLPPPPPPQVMPVVSGMISGVFLSGLVMSNPLWVEAAEDEEQKKERLKKMGNKVLRHVNAHETERLGELSRDIREKMDYLKKSASFTNDQWKCFAELNQQLNEMIGDPYDPESTESD